MKEFVKMTLAVMCGLFLMGIVGFFLFGFPDCRSRQQFFHRRPSP